MRTHESSRPEDAAAAAGARLRRRVPAEIVLQEPVAERVRVASPEVRAGNDGDQLQLREDVDAVAAHAGHEEAVLAAVAPEPPQVSVLEHVLDARCGRGSRHPREQHDFAARSSRRAPEGGSSASMASSSKTAERLFARPAGHGPEQPRDDSRTASGRFGGNAPGQLWNAPSARLPEGTANARRGRRLT